MPERATKPLPAITPETEPYWEGCHRGELRLQPHGHAEHRADLCHGQGRPDPVPGGVGQQHEGAVRDGR